MKTKKPRQIKDILAMTFRYYNIPIDVEEAKVFNSWAEIVGESISSHCLPSIVKKGRLYVEVDSPVWRHQLNFMKNEIIKKLNKSAGKEVIKEIIFKLNTKITSKNDEKVV